MHTVFLYTILERINGPTLFVEWLGFCWEQVRVIARHIDSSQLKLVSLVSNTRAQNIQDVSSQHQTGELYISLPLRKPLEAQTYTLHSAPTWKEGRQRPTNPKQLLGITGHLLSDITGPTKLEGRGQQ